MKKKLAILGTSLVGITLILVSYFYLFSPTYSVDELLSKVEPGNSAEVKVEGIVDGVKVSDEIRFELKSNIGSILTVVMKADTERKPLDGDKVVVKGLYSVEQVFVAQSLSKIN